MGEESSSLNSISPKQMRISELLLVITTILWGTTFIVTNVLTQIIPPMFYMGVRYLIAVLGFFPLYPHLRKVTKEHLKIAFIAGTICWISFATQTIGIKLTTATKSAFLTGLNILMVPIFVAIIYKKKVPGRIWISTLIAVTGVSVMSFAGFESVALGDILVLICDVFYAIYIIYLDNNLKKVDIISFSILILAVMSLESFIASMLFEPISLIFGESAPLIFTWQNLWIMLYMGLVASVGATLCQNYGQKYVTSTRAAIIFALEPLFATFFAVLFGESLEIKTIIGGIMIIIGIFFSIERSLEKKNNEKC